MNREEKARRAIELQRFIEEECSSSIKYERTERSVGLITVYYGNGGLSKPGKLEEEEKDEDDSK